MCSPFTAARPVPAGAGWEAQRQEWKWGSGLTGTGRRWTAHIECVYILVYVEFVYVGQGPVACNQALVIPVCKRGGKLDPTNYRPVAVTEPLMRL